MNPIHITGLAFFVGPPTLIHLFADFLEVMNTQEKRGVLRYIFILAVIGTMAVAISNKLVELAILLPPSPTSFQFSPLSGAY